MKKVSKSQFKPKALQYMRDVERTGEPIVITDRGKPTLELRPVSAQGVKQDPMTYLKGVVLDYVDPTQPVGEEDWDQNE
ncbi:MAG: prevent-host-death family protein [Patiriisocius sp.]|jgi:prevent-host-death family protein